jgi:glycyl-tRNA synthetase alpha subunit
MMVYNIVAVILLSFYTSVRNQDMQFGCITCADIFDRCELDCSFDLQSENSTVVHECHEDCLQDKKKCVDTDNAVNCEECALDCGQEYDSAMRTCLTLVSRTTKRSYVSSMADCEKDASTTMDTCMAACADLYLHS